MSGFGRALRGELYAIVRRRSFALAVGSILLLVPLRVAGAYLWLRVFEGDAGAGQLLANKFNFWPRFAQGSRFGLVLSELALLVLLGGSLPREIRDGVARDPLVRRISRRAFVLARAAVAIVVPLLLALVATGSAALWSAAFFDAGHVITEPVSFVDDPAARVAYESWLDEIGATQDQLAAFYYLLEETGDAAEAQARTGFPVAEVPDEHYSFVPILITLEEDIRGSVVAALRRGILPLVGLGLFAFLFSVVFATGALASGLALGAVVLFGVFLSPELGKGGWWVSSSWLPGIGYHSSLGVAQRVADGYTDTPPIPVAALRAAWQGSLAMSAASLALALMIFPRRRL